MQLQLCICEVHLYAYYNMIGVCNMWNYYIYMYMYSVQDRTEEIAGQWETSIILEKESEIRDLQEQLVKKEERLCETLQRIAEKESSIPGSEQEIGLETEQEGDKRRLGDTEMDNELQSARRKLANQQDLLAQLQKRVLEKEKEVDILRQRMRSKKSATMVRSVVIHR